MDFDSQLALLREHAGRDGLVVETQLLQSGARVVKIRDYPLAAGWDRRTVTIEFYVPASYPSANLDCFWVEEQLRLASGQQPTASNPNNPMPEAGRRGTWFSWHIPSWRPNHSTLVTFFNGIRLRLDQAQ